MTKLSEPMRRALAVLAETELEVSSRGNVWRYPSGERVSGFGLDTLSALQRRDLCTSRLSITNWRWRITDAGRAALAAQEPADAAE
jgi:hypothetical protein